MSTMAEVRTPPVPGSSAFRILRLLILLVVLTLAAIVAYAYHAALAALPQVDGQIKLNGISAQVTVTRDSHGVPAIEAASLDDLFFAQGYVTAQDRLWQMDVMRRFAAGELSEILGEDTLNIDREQRILGLGAAAKKGLLTASPRDRAYFGD